MSAGKHNIQDPRVVSDFAASDFCRDALLYYADSPLYVDENERYEKHFYGRKLRPHVLKHIDHSTPIDVACIGNYSALSANRVLASIYEQDFLILPESNKTLLSSPEFSEFYSPRRKAAASCALPMLEHYLFDFLGKEIEITGDWNLDTVSAYFAEYVDEQQGGEQVPLSVRTLEEAADRETAVQDFLIQLAPDFLLESSPMARYASGSFGKLGSSLFKVIIDELGYGVHDQKHSVLFAETMSSAELDPSVHTYWQYYLNGSLLLSNYYNMITRDKRHFFRYIGAIYQAETAFISTCAQWQKALKAILPNLDLRYFAEHVHIDQYHSKMVFDNLVSPAIRRYGDTAAAEIVRGFEEACWLSEYAETDFNAQIEWKNSSDEYQRIHDQIFTAAEQRSTQGAISKQTFIEPSGELSVTHTHDEDELCHINSGTMEYLNGFGKSTVLKKGEGIVIRKGRLHGALIMSAECDYSIYTIGDYKEWL